MTRGMKWDIESTIKDVFDVIWSRLITIRDMCSNDDMTKEDIETRIESLLDEIGD